MLFTIKTKKWTTITLFNQLDSKHLIKPKATYLPFLFVFDMFFEKLMERKCKITLPKAWETEFFLFLFMDLEKLRDQDANKNTQY